MESALISSSSSFLRFNPLHSRRVDQIAVRPRKLCISAAAAPPPQNGRDYYGGGGRVVDENMIVLRKRIHEMKMMERNYEPPSDWMDWEKRFYSSYDSFVCDSVGLLQTFLMNSRPSVAFGTLFLLLISVPISSAVVAFRLLDFAHWILASAGHLS
ncbi:PREDICTED: uncharacterized protein LOC104824149 [Tarenaya hassleriana]|uniref:uncharacterized protein LOC104824149 n=1 Tax=Tarenaya hassleriana TaxID=28532 RepID=UPI00053C797A|nr:PREDICTED: uncharacterized protein LOC104824149 [Tarenaya hassleriana]